MQFFETIKLEGNKLLNLDYHQKRMDKTRLEVLGLKEPIQLCKKILIPKELSAKIMKCRVTYSGQIENIEFEIYNPRKIKTLKIIIDNDIVYNYKFYDREQLNNLLKQKGVCDEILIVKNGLISDTSFSNIVFFDGRKFITPSQPLLKGTKRQKLLDTDKIKEEAIRLSDLKNFQSAYLINAMLDFESAVKIKMEDIV
ncbi:MAG: hypothetical protein DRJ05_13520 [Bacteroidetes bacterium]|nr:MAG: hypothetical protein DRJ05_13520 [Bacteroidota bacterium]